ncbi:hypothetical protein SDC9_137089 [bioreactor metagenome]|uniref:Uncharacterized protein n=1 Tax=bioreactor metagenome TaxID=1076179 RepID=A0A645DMF5_9ZZZZ
MRNLALAFVEVLNLKTQQVAGGGKREARARAVVSKEGDAEAGIKNLRGDVALAEVAKRVGNGEHRVQFVTGFFPRQEKVAFVHVVKLQVLQFLRELLDVFLFTHKLTPKFSCLCW